jgi:hypothetical protein
MGTGTHVYQLFCETTLTDSTNVLTDTQYSTDIDRLKGHQKGIARLQLENKVLRQTSIMSAGLAEFIIKYCSNTQNFSVGDVSPETKSTIADKLKAAVQNQTFPAGTRLAFSQNVAPVGWVQVNDSSTGGHMLRIINNTTVTGAGVGIISSGGIHSPILMDVVPAHTHTGSTTSADLNHSHDFNANTSNESVPHNHGYERPTLIADTDRGTLSSLYSIDVTDTGTTGYQNQNHVHNVSGTTAGMRGGQSQYHAHTFSTDVGSSKTNWQPKYLDFILCTKS